MRIDPKDLQPFSRSLGPPPAPVEPRLSPADEARAIRSGGDDPIVLARRARALALIRRPARPEGADAELLALLAEAKALPLEGDRDWLRAKQRLHEIAEHRDPPAEVRAVLRRLKVRPGDGAAFAEKALPARRDVQGSGSDMGSGYGGGGGGGGGE